MYMSDGEFMFFTILAIIDVFLMIIMFKEW
jgi:hypothetical protein